VGNADGTSADGHFLQEGSFFTTCFFVLSSQFFIVFFFVKETVRFFTRSNYWWHVML